MATETGVWDIQDVRDKQLASEWTYDGRDPHKFFGWGQNSQGQLGINLKSPGTSANRSSPVQVGTTNTWYRAADGLESNQMSAIKSNGTIWSWGYGNYGALGHNNNTPQSSPLQIGTDTTWEGKGLSIGERFMQSRKTDGTLWMWGHGGAGRLAQNNQVNYSSPMQIPGTWADGSCGNKHAYGVKTDGTLWAWGEDGSGQLGQNTTTSYSSPIQIGTGTDWSSVIGQWYGGYALKTDGSLWNFGANDAGQLGLNSQTPAGISSPMQIPGTWGTEGIGKLSGGREHNMSINSSGELFGMGSNGNGQLGDNTTTQRSSPTQVPGSYKWVVATSGASGAIKTDGTLWTWGDGADDASGQLGLNESTPRRSSPCQVGTETDWQTMGSSMGSIYGLQTP